MKLYKVMLVDDDYLVLQDLKALLNWEAQGFRVVATASNGRQTLSLLKKHRPHLIVCDISMPVMDGLEFIRLVRESGSEVHIIVLSSYDNFQYAQRAISYNVEHYILKNEMTAEAFQEKLRDIASRLGHAQHVSERLTRVAFSDYFSAVQGGPGTEADRAGRDTPADMERLLAGRYAFLCLYAHQPLERMNRFYRHREDAGHDLLRQMAVPLADRQRIPILFYVGNVVVAGYAQDKDAWRGRSSYEREAATLLDSLAAGSDGACAAYLPENMRPAQFREVFGRMLPLMQYYSVFPGARVTNMAGWFEKTHMPTTHQFNYSVLRQGLEDTGVFHERVEGHCAILFENRDLDGIVRFYGNLMSYFEEMTGGSLRFDQPVYFSGREQFVQYIRTTFEKCRIFESESAEALYSPAARKAIYHMEQNFQDSGLSVEGIAASAGLSASRLSALFKKETGKTVGDFLTDLRIRHAVGLLQGSNLKIYEVAERVGYQSSQYFSQILARRTGKRPMDFKRSQPAAGGAYEK